MAIESQNERLVWPLLVVVQIAYCFWHIFAKRALLSGDSPLVLAFYREIIACCCMYILASAVDGKQVWSDCKFIDKYEYIALGALSFGNTIGFIIALNYITTLNSALLHPTIPVFSAFLASAAGLESMTPLKMIGVCCCASGAIVVTIFGIKEHSTEIGGTHILLGNIILILQCLSMAGLLVLQKIVLCRGIPPTTLTARYYSITACFVMLVTVSTSTRASFSLSHESIIAVFYGAIISVSFIYCALAWANKYSAPTTASLSMTLQPPFNAVLSVSL